MSALKITRPFKSKRVNAVPAGSEIRFPAFFEKKFLLLLVYFQNNRFHGFKIIVIPALLQTLKNNMQLRIG